MFMVVMGGIENFRNIYSMSELLRLLNNVNPWHCAVMDIKLNKEVYKQYFIGEPLHFESYKFSRMHWNGVYNENYP